VEHLREFGLSRDPFANDPQPAFYYASPAHRSAEKRLLRGVTQSKGLCLLVGETGAGKSLLARRLVEELEEEAYEASLLLILQSGVDARWLLGRVAARVGVEEPADAPLDLLAQIYDRLSSFCEEGRRPVMVIDDAHLLARPELMQALRGLLDLQYEDRHLLTLVLVGQPELDRVLALDPSLPDRVEVRVRLEALDAGAATAYVAHRLNTAGGHPALFEPEAVEALHRLSRGLPRRINTLADNALFEAHLANRARVRPEDVERAAHDLGWDSALVGPVADSLDAEAGFERSEPGDEPLELGTRALDEELDKPEEAPVFDSDSPPTVLIAESEEGVERDVEELFDQLMDD
jgi:type II secretory pathway predicted ATPase ExeA